jgi:DNA-binding NtrC family response regulator
LLGDLLEASPALHDALPGIVRAARSHAPILLLGEAGTGKSVLARACHQASERAHGPLIEVDPAAVPSSLFESELFGYEAGAFTGAGVAYAGRATRADGGTLVLDRVELLPAQVQPKLLRLLAEARFAPLGGRERTSDLRFIALAADDLLTRVEQGLFRPDLFYRLEVLAFRLPPLRARREDLESISASMLEDLAGRFQRRVPTLSSRALDWMGQHTWPGNLRELRNVIERAMVTSTAHELDPPPPRSQRHRLASLAELEREHLRTVLAHTRGHQGRAAEILGISRKALWEKRKRYGIP